MQEIETTVAPVQEVETINEPVSGEEVVPQEVVTQEVQDQVNESAVFDLDKMLDDLLAQGSEDQDQKFGPSFDTNIVHKSEQEALEVAQKQKETEAIAELETLRTESEKFSSERDQVIEQLTQIQTERDELASQNAEFDEFVTKLIEVPVLGELVTAIANGKEVNIPAYFAALKQKEIGVFSEAPTQVVPAIVIPERNTTDLFLESMNRGNKRRN